MQGGLLNCATQEHFKWYTAMLIQNQFKIPVKKNNSDKLHRHSLEPIVIVFITVHTKGIVHTITRTSGHCYRIEILKFFEHLL